MLLFFVCLVVFPAVMVNQTTECIMQIMKMKGWAQIYSSCIVVYRKTKGTNVFLCASGLLSPLSWFMIIMRTEILIENKRSSCLYNIGQSSEQVQMVYSDLLKSIFVEERDKPCGNRLGWWNHFWQDLSLLSCWSRFLWSRQQMF